MMKTKFEIPARENVSPAHQTIYDNLTRSLGFVPNLYAAFAHSDNALSIFLAAQNTKSSLTVKEKEAISLIVSEVNECRYCLSSHSAMAHKYGFTDQQIIEIRRGSVSFDDKLAALVKLSKSIIENKGHADTKAVSHFLDSGYSKANLIDVIMLIGLRSITNYVYAITQVEIDWPLAAELENTTSH